VDPPERRTGDRRDGATDRTSELLETQGPRLDDDDTIGGSTVGPDKGSDVDASLRRVATTATASTLNRLSE
jgi:hypothetical protein